MEQLKIRGTKSPKNPFTLSEHELMNWCISYLSLRGHFVQRINTGRAFIRDDNGKVIRTIMLAETGSPDIIGFHGKDGRYIGIEIKVKPNKPEPAQLQFIENINRCGGIGAIVYSQEELMKIL